MKKYAISILIGLAVAGVALAAPSYIFQRSIMPEANNTYDLGSTTMSKIWRGIYSELSSSTNAIFGTATTTSLAITNLPSGSVPYIWSGGQVTSTTSLTYTPATNLLTVGNNNTPTGKIIARGSTYAARMGDGDGNGPRTDYGTVANPAAYGSVGAYGGAFNISGNNGTTIFGAGGVAGMYLLPTTLRLGIGTATPITKMQMVYDSGGAVLTGNSAYGGIHLTPGIADGRVVGITTGGASSATYMANTNAGILFQSSGAYGTKMYFGTTNSYATGMATRMLIDQNGRIGIGTTTPDSTLDITGVAGTNNVFSISSSTNAYLLVLKPTGLLGIGTNAPAQTLDVQGNIAMNGSIGSGKTWGRDSSASYGTLNLYNTTSGFTQINNQAYGISFQTAGTDKMTILNDGKVGIGTNAPGVTLDVAGAGLFTSTVANTIGVVRDVTTTATQNSVARFQSQNTTGTALDGFGTKIELRMRDSLGTYSQGSFFTSRANSTSTSADFGINVYNQGVETEGLRVLYNGNVGIGKTAPQTKLDVFGTASTSNLIVTDTATTSRLVVAVPTANVSPTTSLISFKFAGVEKLRLTTDGYSNIILGNSAAGAKLEGSPTGINNIFIGDGVGANATSATRNTCIGVSSCASLTSGHRNFGGGLFTLNSVTTGTYNTGIGTAALFYVATGSNNSALGREAGWQVMGNDNTAVGYWALNGLAKNWGNANTALGSQALRYITNPANKNWAGGTEAMWLFQTGDSNFGAGYRAGYNLVNGSGNIFIGNETYAKSANENYTMNIANLIFATGLTATGTVVSTSSLGIATNSPLAALDVYRASSTTGILGRFLNELSVGLHMFSNGVTWLGGLVNHTKFEADGTMVSEGTATTWEDLRFPATAINPAGAPSAMSFDTTNLGFNAAAAGTTSIAVIAQMPHSWKVGSDIYPHIHWEPTTGGTGDVVWNIEYKWTNINAAEPAAWTFLQTVSSAAEVDYYHQLATLPTMSGSGKTLSSIISIKISRNGGSASDNYSANALLKEFDIHYESDTLGSRTELEK